jgi:hypothetical protein
MGEACKECVEEWRPVVGWEDLYEVSDQGRVRSLDRWVEGRNRGNTITRYRKAGRVLRPKRKKKPTAAYALVSLARDGTVTTISVHTLVLEAWVGPRPPGAWARHGPLGLTYDGVTNLSWGTPQDNAQDRLNEGHDHKTNLTHCPWGHRLAEPNLDPWWAAKGTRRCRACALTQSWGNYRGLHPRDPEWQAEAHRRYDEILHFGRPINYSKQRWTPGQ